MNRHELFIAGCKLGRWRWRSWRISLFSVTKLPLEIPADLDEEEQEIFSIYEPEQYDIDYRTDGVYWFDKEQNVWNLIEGADPSNPLYNDRELATFPALTCINQPEEIETTYGRMLYNFLVVTYAFGDKIPFFHKGRSGDMVKKFASKAVDDDYVPKEGELVFFASEIAKFVKAQYELPSMAPYVTPTGTEHSLTTDPRVEKVRDELLAKYGNGRKLTAVDVAEIQEVLINMDIEWLSQDESIDFFISRKAIAVKRKKLFLLHGLETAFQKEGYFTLIAKPLYKGTDMSQLPAVFSAIREGSYDRGADTALGGEKVTFLQRIYQNTKIIPGDCGTKILYRFTLTEYNFRAYIGLNMFDGVGYVELTEELAKANINKVIAIRRPLLCKATHTDFCEVCCGKALSRSPRAVASEISNVGSDIMYAFMSSMHGTELSTAKYIPGLHIR